MTILGFLFPCHRIETSIKKAFEEGGVKKSSIYNFIPHIPTIHNEPHYIDIIIINASIALDY